MEKGDSNAQESTHFKNVCPDIQPIDRALQAILLSQFRSKIFEKHGWMIKPVILFKSKTIKDSNAFLDEFMDANDKIRLQYSSKYARIAN